MSKVCCAFFYRPIFIALATISATSGASGKPSSLFSQRFVNVFRQPSPHNNIAKDMLAKVFPAIL